jgi:hypothetical protein
LSITDKYHMTISCVTNMSKPKTTLAILFAVVIAIGFVASSSSFIVSALAARGGGQSDNGCGLTGQSAASSLGREVGADTSSNAKAGGGQFGSAISGGASGCSGG